MMRRLLIIVFCFSLVSISSQNANITFPNDSLDFYVSVNNRSVLDAFLIHKDSAAYLRLWEEVGNSFDVVSLFAISPDTLCFYKIKSGFADFIYPNIGTTEEWEHIESSDSITIKIKFPNVVDSINVTARASNSYKRVGNNYKIKVKQSRYNIIDSVIFKFEKFDDTFDINITVQPSDISDFADYTDLVPIYDCYTEVWIPTIKYDAKRGNQLTLTCPRFDEETFRKVYAVEDYLKITDNKLYWRGLIFEKTSPDQFKEYYDKLKSRLSELQ